MYLNDLSPFAAEWVQNLWPHATVDQRDIRDVRADDVAGFRRCHFFAGIGGWEYALQLAGWPDEWPVWTGSCPCQPFSSAGKRKGTADERHLWPEFRRLIGECRPPAIFGEQVASKLGREWLDGVSADLERMGYAVGSADLCAAGVGTPQLRQRLWWGAVALAGSQGSRFARCQYARTPGEETEQGTRLLGVGGYGEPEQLAGGGGGARLPRLPLEPARQECAAAERSGAVIGVGSATAGRRSRRNRQDEQEQRPWEGFSALLCTDGKARRISTEPGDEPLVNGIPRDLGRRFPELRSMARSARTNRVGRLRGYGNAIVPPLAAVFVRSFLESLELTA